MKTAIYSFIDSMLGSRNEFNKFHHGGGASMTTVRSRVRYTEIVNIECKVKEDIQTGL
jgi:hypothetical protein